ncbi:peptidylprolyl isomerase [Xanthomonas hyacinthi]|uniref:Peptidylprolyl isomerase n=1 Tax=Xanthomonas hyacinthi TaxID=56455 RepID=A0A2S7EN05_9XANT|nr:peptidylprolyl isomerase [Xanthomonas hyacinthi]KLD76508.1 peptidylprolyl isomerase [Xanthomonas hyacinthi DSM 19077]PPU92390.1 peptidylprolyl isomerase [Xanthomonas hyacinthi]QGY77066.1 peptidylprolyl isomerase [Xanthomonas hyacinthi]
MSLSLAKRGAAIACLLAACHIAAAAAADDPDSARASADPVVLRLGAARFTASEYRALAGAAAPTGAGIDDPAAVRQFADRLLLLEQARQQHLERDPVVAARLRRAADAILAESAMSASAEHAHIDQAQLQRQFHDHPGDYDEYHLSHIFVALHPQAAARRGHDLSEAQALQRAEALKRQLDAGADFATLAVRESDDGATVADGGQLSAAFGRYLADPFVAPVQQLAVHQVSAPVRGPDGYHLIRLDAKTQARFDAVRGQIEVQLREQAAAQALQQLRQAHPLAFDRAAYAAAVR